VRGCGKRTVKPYQGDLRINLLVKGAITREVGYLSTPTSSLKTKGVPNRPLTGRKKKLQKPAIKCPLKNVGQEKRERREGCHDRSDPYEEGWLTHLVNKCWITGKTISKKGPTNRKDGWRQAGVDAVGRKSPISTIAENRGLSRVAESRFLGRASWVRRAHKL